MKKPGYFWTDEREADLKTRLEALGADEGLIRFLWEWGFPTWEKDQIIPRVRGTRWQSYQRKIKRSLQKAWPEEWRTIWREEHLPWFRASRNTELHLRSGPTRSEIATVELVRKRGRPREIPWSFVWLLQAYFRRVTKQGRPYWPEITEIVAKYSGHDYQDPYDLQSAWQKNKGAFREGNAEFDADTFLESYLRLYGRRLRAGKSGGSERE